MSEQLTCNSCIKYVGDVQKGKCCANPPIANTNGIGVFPVIYGMVDWCYQHKEIAVANKETAAKKAAAKKPPPKPPTKNLKT